MRAWIIRAGYMAGSSELDTWGFGCSKTSELSRDRGVWRDLRLTLEYLALVHYALLECTRAKKKTSGNDQGRTHKPAEKRQRGNMSVDCTFPTATIQCAFPGHRDRGCPLTWLLRRSPTFAPVQSVVLSATQQNSAPVCACVWIQNGSFLG